MFVGSILSIIFLLPYSLQADYNSVEDDNKSRQRFPKVRDNNHIHSSEHHKYRKHRTKDVDYSSEEKSEECQCTCENCTEKSCCDKDICDQCILQQSSVMLIPYSYPYMMPQYNVAVGDAIPASSNVTVTSAQTTIGPTTTSQSPISFNKPEEKIASNLYNRRKEQLAEHEIIRNYILSKIDEERHATMKQLNSDAVRDLQKTPPRRVDKSIFKAGRTLEDDEDTGGNPYEDVERLLQYVKSVRKEKVRPEMKDIQG